MPEIDLEERAKEITAYISSQRDHLVETWDDWHARLEDAYKLAEGQYHITRQDATQEVNNPLISNLADIVPKDVARLVAETSPKLDSPAKDDSKTETTRALMREAIGDTYWDINDCETFEPEWSMDLSYAGAAFAVVWAEAGKEYPCVMRVAPESAYPNIHNNEFVDLLTIERVPMLVADKLWPGANIKGAYQAQAGRLDKMVEVLHYYSRTEYVQAVACVGMDRKPVEGMWVITGYDYHDLGECPAKMVKTPAARGRFAGLLDQIQESLMLRDKMVRLSTEYVEQQVNAPFLADGILNADDPPGPKTIYRKMPGHEGPATMTRVPPAGSAPQLFALMQMVEEEQRSALSYPRARQGDVSQSIASGAFVDATMGSLSSLVKEHQRLLSKLRRKVTAVSMSLDEKMLNKEKSMIRPVDGKWTYSPADVIDGRYFVSVNYGAAAGIGPLNADVRLLQYLGTGVISKEDVRDNLDFTPDTYSIKDKLDREHSDEALAQRFLTDPNVSFDEVVAANILQYEKGLSLRDAAIKARAEAAQAQQAMMQQQQQAQAAMQTLAPPTEVNPAGDQLALTKGEIPPEAGLESEDISAGFTPPPFSYIQVR